MNQPFHHFPYVTAHSPTLLSLYLHHSSFSNPSVASPTSQFILQPFFRFSASQALHLIHLASRTWHFHSSFPYGNLDKFHCMLNKTMSSAHSPTFPSLHLRHNSFSNPSVDLPTSQLILQHFRCFTCVTVHSPTLLSLLLRHKLFT